MSRWILGLAVVAACDVVPPVERPPWTEVPLPPGADGVPRRRLESAVAALGTRLVIAGGYSTSLREGLMTTNEVIAYDTLAGTFEDLPPLDVSWSHGQLAGNGGILYMLGGHEDASANASGQSFVLPLGGEAWEAIEPMPEGLERGAAGVLVSPPYIYLFGGANRMGPLASNLQFDTVTRTWSRLFPDLPTARSHPAVMETFDGTVVIAGGLDDANRPLGDVWQLPPDFVTPPEDQLWQLAEPMPTNRGGCAYGTAFGALLCAGGEAGIEALDTVEKYDPDGAIVDDVPVDQWTELEPMPEPRAGAQGTVIGGSLYVVGGSLSRMFEPTDSILVLAYVEHPDGPLPWPF
ncbi:MAG: kelch repeat-containing protein [Kofleriaceae bacterium]